jgi:hypothetical protein
MAYSLQLAKLLATLLVASILKLDPKHIFLELYIGAFGSFWYNSVLRVT